MGKGVKAPFSKNFGGGLGVVGSLCITETLWRWQSSVTCSRTHYYNFRRKYPITNLWEISDIFLASGNLLGLKFHCTLNTNLKIYFHFPPYPITQQFNSHSIYSEPTTKVDFRRNVTLTKIIVNRFLIALICVGCI